MEKWLSVAKVQVDNRNSMKKCGNVCSGWWSITTHIATAKQWNGTRIASYKPRVCAFTIHRALEGQLITPKKLEKVPRERNREDIKLKWLAGNIVSGCFKDRKETENWKSWCMWMNLISICGPAESEEELSQRTTSHSIGWWPHWTQFVNDYGSIQYPWTYRFCRSNSSLGRSN